MEKREIQNGKSQESRRGFVDEKEEEKRERMRQGIGGKRRRKKKGIRKVQEGE